jgi:hypothetical protein
VAPSAGIIQQLPVNPGARLGSGDVRAMGPFSITLVFLLGLVLLELIAILVLNAGHLVYTLDDSYIHLALAENILRGHYGVNAAEMSAPSSSIIWPFILSPFASSPIGEYLPLLLNVLCAIAALALFNNIAGVALAGGTDRGRSLVLGWFLLLWLLCTNAIGLIFTGMEHSLQTLVVVAIAWGLIVDCQSGIRPAWLAAAIIVAPLVRYENLGVSLAAIAYLLGRGHRATAATALVAIAVLLGGFSVFLVSLGLEPFPTSVIAKSSIVRNQGSIAALLDSFKNSLGLARGVYLVICLIAMLVYAAFAANDRKKWLAATSSLAVVAHLMAGRYGWYNRYELYVWSFSLAILFYLTGPHLSRVLAEGQSRHALKLVGVTGIGTILVCSPYIVGLGTLPLASNNIHEQQHQMHRFAAEFYAKPVAVNDVGYVSYRNDNYVLDLWGLASLDALRQRRNGGNPEWINELVASKGVGAAMIYEEWFDGKIPSAWIKIGRLYLGRRTITPAIGAVSFYATSGDSYPEALEAVRTFQKTLPAGVEFTLEAYTPR